MLALALLSPACMDPLTAIAASGLRARMESLDMLANNIANASTGGYKADREFYNLYTSPEAAGDDSLSTMPLIERPWVDHSQGILHTTGNALDVAISGKGFFAVDGLHPTALDVVIAAVEHFTYLAQFIEVAGHSVLNQLVGGTAGFSHPVIDFRLKLRILKMHVHNARVGA